MICHEQDVFLIFQFQQMVVPNVYRNTSKDHFRNLNDQIQLKVRLKLRS